jgi:hypothetical protein
MTYQEERDGIPPKVGLAAIVIYIVALGAAVGFFAWLTQLLRP